ncbi:MAG: VWA domain-containing protein [Mycobacteriaceae bacterium]
MVGRSRYHNTANMVVGLARKLASSSRSQPSTAIPRIDISTLSPANVTPLFSSPQSVTEALSSVGYQANTHTAQAVFLADLLGRPLLIEGAAGVGKTELAKAISRATGAQLRRLQCYEGVGEAKALYEWNHAKQILRMQSDQQSATQQASNIYSREYLLERPLLAALTDDSATVLLIDEVDKADIEFDALVLEVLSDFSVTVTECGTIHAHRRPLVLITSNASRELSEALKRRCLHLYLESPTPETERRIIFDRTAIAQEKILHQITTINTATSQSNWSQVLLSLAKYDGGTTTFLLDYLIDFIAALRLKGVPVGLSEAIDSSDAIAEISLGDREQVRESLCCTMVHQEVQRKTFYALFELWFPPRILETAATENNTDTPELSAIQEQLADLLTSQSTESGQQLEELISNSVLEFGEYNSASGISFSALNTMRQLDEQTMGMLIQQSFSAKNPGNSLGQSRLAERAAEQQLQKLRTLVEQQTQQLVAQHQGKERVASYAVPQSGSTATLPESYLADIQEIHHAVTELGKLFASRNASLRRQARAGEIDMRKTMRKSMSTGGVPIKLIRRRPRQNKPELVVLCDMSSSVAEFSYFTLLLVHSLRAEFLRVRIFAFIDTVDEVSSLFTAGSHLGESIAQLNTHARIVEADGRSDYGHTLEVFHKKYFSAITPKTTLLIIGDARSNYRHNNSHILKELTSVAKHAHWLNPEQESQWGAGDSAALVYQADITMHECHNAQQLAAVVTTLLPA